MSDSRIFDLKVMSVFPYGEREKNVFFHGDGFKTRIIELPAGGAMPDCQMSTAVIFYVVSGEVEITIGAEKHLLNEGFCLVGESSVYSMKSPTGVKILCVQIETGKSNLQP